MMVTIDDETLARAVLTFCLNSADAMMYALVKGTGSAASALQLIADSGPGNHENVTAAACTSLDAAFINGVTRWGRTINARGMASFHGSLVSWQQRLASLPSKDPDALRDWFTADGTQWIIAPHHPCWPSQLNDLSLRTDWASPLCLWGKGDPKALVSCPEPVGIVGSRGVSDYGRQSAHELALRMARAGHLVVSGGALGTDAAAHWGAVKAMDEMSAALAGRTVAVFAGGLNHIGPKSNQNLFEQIESHSGALISELCPGTVPEARRFLLRNRLIAALSSTLIVAQARARSGALTPQAGRTNSTAICSPCRETSPCRITPAAIALSKTAEPPSSAHWRRSTNYAIARIARNMSTCRMTPNIRRNRQTNPTMPYSPPLKLAPKQTATSPPTICSI